MSSSTAPAPATPRPTPIGALDAGAAAARTGAEKNAKADKKTGDMDAGTDGLVLKNQLAQSRSPYVRGHANNPVQWQMWSPETLALAKKYNRVLFVSIGYAACHWCHVMERESFENEDIARILNGHFIPIKVDREERPDIDRIYMNFVQATTGSGGWPLNVFLTPDLEPVFGGTYWPGPHAMGDGMMKDQMGFAEVLQKIVEAWTDQQQKFLASAKEIMPKLRDFADEGLKGSGGADEPEEPLEIELLEEAYQHFMTLYDPNNGGFGLPPKFPVPVKLAFLLRLGTFPSAVVDIVGERECNNARDMVMKTLRNMANGGIKDQIGHGFHRYSVTANWSLPHFEKMLYDNAQLLSVYLDAWLVTGDKDMLETAIDTADYLCDDALKNAEGGFFSSEGADSLYRRNESEKREGAFYVWTRREFDTILGEQESSICAKYWDVHRDGNVGSEDDAHDEFIHQNVLAVVTTVERLSQMYGMSEDRITSIIAEARQKLCDHRNQERPRPNLDDKIVTSWNGLAIGALARAAAVLETSHPEKASKYRKNAVDAAAFIRKHLYDEKTQTLKRVYRDGAGDTNGFADDYAFLISGLISLYETTFDATFLAWADALQRSQLGLFWDAAGGGFFSTEASANDLILRLKDGLDSQEPSTNGISASNLLHLSTLLGQSELAQHARRTCNAFAAELLEHPSLFASLMASIVAANLGMRSAVLAGRVGDPEVKAHLKRLRAKLRANTTVVVLDPDVLKEADGKGKETEKESGKEKEKGKEKEIEKPKEKEKEKEKGTQTAGAGPASPNACAKWLLDCNSLYRETLESLERKGGAVLQVCEGTQCLDAFDMSDMDKVLEELG